jgi:hypothetical protein
VLEEPALPIQPGEKKVSFECGPRVVEWVL